jgi:hypothetical protein
VVAVQQRRGVDDEEQPAVAELGRGWGHGGPSLPCSSP